MKIYCLVLILFMNFQQAPAEIKNGYESQIPSVRRSLEGLQDLLRETTTLSAGDKNKLQDKIRLLMEFIAYHDITEIMLDEFKMLAPELYQEINDIRDSKGRTTDVYVRFISKDQTTVQAAGTTCLGQAIGDIHAYTSEYGMYTVSIKIWIISKALWVSAHELGHVKHQVPNLNDYVKFYKNTYPNRRNTDPNYIGHEPHDPSGKNAVDYEKRFRMHYSRHLKRGYKPESPILLLRSIRRKVETETFRGNALLHVISFRYIRNAPHRRC